MSHLSLYEELDQAIDQMLAVPDAEISCEENISELLGVAKDLRDLPRENFKARLMLELEWEASGRTVSTDAERKVQTAGELLPSLSGRIWNGYPVRRINFAMSVLLHAAMAFLVGAGFFLVKSTAPLVERTPNVTIRLEPYPAPVGLRGGSGGGTGGNAEKNLASMGAAPRAAREQLTPPIVVQNNLKPRLVADESVVAPPDLNFPRTRQVGDPLSTLTIPSNGPGAGGGMNGRVGTGVGGEDGDGRGPGRNGCCGFYNVGNGVSMPRAIYSPEPEFSEEARKAKFQGEVTLLAVIGADGRPRNLSVIRSLGMGLDEKALETVRTWRFEPARKDGHAVAVQMQIVINFHLF